jgi:hypothetical protein
MLSDMTSPTFNPSVSCTIQNARAIRTIACHGSLRGRAPQVRTTSMEEVDADISFIRIGSPARYFALDARAA